ncbi:DHA1 family bicyclomycin/chloramphenicol resistance-like MFS transporter [Microbacterium endophyticum]|uniref:DHA1 family bicyclomycin/chloramphenicol resistance-like MFS transporter n=1 Tax=Microbacterium endophyticum TaxID=1526412 RepID=A0A7W4YN88_9MICO|nr:multidrug effflux MFS transporter [Microbacterium endophyticum]MBB2975907.1 DHA1 family bicyclomycin/chloramphenicol resistance-like MFS transporter [Microbacterium endophyticum]NIK36390.1 DHA1 family bicyclomycin/chloramphenicol resistance-like MFS transporter [Microbacterium endophyticum]
MSTDTATTPTSPSVTTAAKVSVPVLLVLALLSAIAPFATDLYLPAFPEMVIDLSTTATLVQLTLTAFLLGITLGQLVFGSLSDRFGRMTPLIAGSLLCVAASVVAVFAPTVAVLIVARFVQGLGAAAGMVIGRAIISDVSSGKAAARAFSLMMIVGGVAPVIAPLVGGFLVSPLGWRGILAVVLGLSVLMLASIFVVLKESFPREARAQRRAQIQSGNSPCTELLSRKYIGYTATFGFAFAVMMAYISASPFVYQDMMGMTALQYGLCFGVNALGLVITSAISAHLAATRSVRALLTGGIAALTASTVVFVLIASSGAPAIWLALPLFTAVASLGFVLGNCTSLALAAAPRSAGLGSAFLGALQFGLAAIVSPLVSLGGTMTAMPLAIVMIICAVIASVSLLVARRADKVLS